MTAYGSLLDLAAPGEKTANDRAEVDLTIDITTNLDAVEKALMDKSDDDGAHGLFKRAGALVHVVREGDSLARRNITVPLGTPHIRTVNATYLRERMDAAATFYRLRSKGGKIERVRVEAPMADANGLLARGDWSLRPLDAVLSAPTLRMDGSVAQSAGYDAETRSLLMFDRVFPEVPEHPTRQQARAAYQLLLDPLADFPAAADYDRAALVAAVLTLVARPAVPGPVPMITVSAPMQATGKTKVVNTVVMMATGRGVTTMAPCDPIEMDKRLLVFAMDGTRAVLIDNVTADLGNDPLAAVLTNVAGEYSSRILAASKSWSGPWRAVMFATGNNLSYTADLPRRVIPIVLDSGMEHPDQRPVTAFRYRDLEAHVVEHHPAYVVAALTILRGHLLAGRPPCPGKPMGSFERWESVVRGAVWWASDGVDPAECRKRLALAAVNPEGDRHRALLAAWTEVAGPVEITVADLIKRAAGHEELADALAAMVRNGDPKDLRRSVGALGTNIAKLVDRPSGGLVLRRGRASRSGVMGWKVVAAEGEA